MSVQLIPRPRSIHVGADSNVSVDTIPVANIRSEGNHPEGYRLNIGNGKIEIEAADRAGEFYARQTLKQIARQFDGQLPRIEIIDWPDFSTRGFMLDISRCKVPSMRTLRALIDLLSALKYNQLQLYTEHTFAYAKHELVWRNASPITPQEIRELDLYCRDRFIELVPNQNSFGHFERWLRHDPYKRLAECPNGFIHPLLGQTKWGATLNPNQESLDFVNDLFDELLPNFSSRKFNVGCDETWELGQGFSKTSCGTLGKHQVYMDYLIGIHKLVSDRGLEMQFWGDIILEQPERARSLPENATAVIWGYEADHPFPEQCAALASAHRSFIVAPGTSSWNSIGGRLENAEANIRSAVENALQFGASGILLTDWGDFGHHQPFCVSYPSIALCAGLSWSRKSNDTLDWRRTIGLACEELGEPSAIQAIEDLGRASNPIEDRPLNATWLNKILFADEPALARALEFVSEAELSECESRLEAVKTAPLPHSTLRSEIEVARDLLSFACKKGIAAHKGKPMDARSIHRELEPILDRFKANWLTRNRPGGLDESIANLTETYSS